MNEMDKLFRLFELDRVIHTRNAISTDDLERMIGGIEKIESLKAEYEMLGLSYPEHFYRIYGKDFIVRAFDCNSYYHWWMVLNVEDKD